MVLKMDPAEGSEKLISREEVVSIATSVAKETVAYYRQDDGFVVSEEDGEHGNEFYVYYKDALPPDTVPNYQKHGYASLQRFIFQGEILVDVIYSPHNSQATRYVLDEEYGVLWLEKDDDSPWRLIQAKFGNEEAQMSETFSLHKATILKADYAPAVHEGIKGFDLVGVSLSDRDSHDIPLPENDVEKLLPAGRFISLEALVRTVVDPSKADEGFSKAIPDFVKTDGFPKLGYDYKFPGMHDYETLRSDTWNATTYSWNGGNINGNAHTLKTETTDPFAWLAFVTFTDESGKSHARALNVTVSRAIVAVGETSEGVPTIKGTVDIEGEPYELEISEDRITFVEKEEIKGRRVEAERERENGVKIYTVHINAEDLRNEVAKGYYYNDLLKGALELYRQRHYTSQ